MTAVVLDASALLAFLFDERGADEVEDVLAGAVASTVNWAEVCQTLIARGADPERARLHLLEAGLQLAPLTVAEAERAAELRMITRDAGLSLADRCCLAVADRLGRPALTADAAWEGLDIGVDIRLVRHPS